ncbi:MAG: diguanylate cyclase [Vulcanimicrobiota bacterium]
MKEKLHCERELSVAEKAEERGWTVHMGKGAGNQGSGNMESLLAEIAHKVQDSYFHGSRTASHYGDCAGTLICDIPPHDMSTLGHEISSLVDLFCSQITLTVENTVTLAAVRKQQQALEEIHALMERQVQQLSALYEVGKAMGESDDPGALLALILDKALEVTKTGEGSIMLHDGKTGELSVFTARGIDALTERKLKRGEISYTSYQKGTGIPGKVFESGKGRIVYERADDVLFTPQRSEGLHNLICVPLILAGEPVGVMLLADKKSECHSLSSVHSPDLHGECRKENTGLFSDEDLRALFSLAAQASIVVKNIRLIDIAMKDSLTGFYHKDPFMKLIEEEIIRSRRHAQSLSLLFLDIDSFRSINDTHGHQIGDEILAAVAGTVKNSVRPVDVLGRFAGGELIILLPEMHLEGALACAEQIREDITRLEMITETAVIRTTVSIGVSTLDDSDVKSSKALIRSASRALCAAKSEGKNRVAALQSDFRIAPDEVMIFY